MGMRDWSLNEAEIDALAKHPECKYAEVYNGLSLFPLMTTWVVHLWRTQECYDEGDPPRHVVQGYAANHTRD